MPADVVIDVYIQLALIELGFYIVFWHMVKIKKNYRVLYVLSYFFFVFFDYVIYGAAELGNEQFYLLVRTISMSISFLLYYWICEDNFWKILAGIVFSDMFGGVSHLLTAYSTKENMDKLTVSFAPEVPYIPLGIIVGEAGFIVLFLVFRKYLIRFSREPMEKKLWVRAFSLFYVLNILMPIISVHSQLVFSHEQSWELGMGYSTLLLIAQMIALYCDKKRTQRQKSYHLRQQNQVLKWHYETLREQIALTGRFRQDVADILGSGDDFFRNYAEGRGEKPGDENTGGEIVNQVLMNKKNQCLEAGIRFQGEIDEIPFEGTEEMDIVTLLYNILDNAIESCLKIKDLKQRWIALDVKQGEGTVSIRCENSRRGDPVLAEGKRTWKKNKRLHGTGMEIIKSVVEKYHGTWSYKEKEEEFFFQVTLPWRRKA